MNRIDKRQNTDMREIRITPGYSKHAEGSCLIEFGDTRVICTASIEDKVPLFIEEEQEEKGWVTAEYSMLPRATHTRNKRNSSGRNAEIQRLIGRSLRSVVDLKAIGKRTIILDCDVIQADGGTRTASITGAFIALAEALKYLINYHSAGEKALKSYIAAISVGILDGQELLDLTYEEDRRVDVDFNLVMTGFGEIVEIQTTAEGRPLSEEQLHSLLGIGKKAIHYLIERQKAILEPSLKDICLFAQR